MCRLLTYCLFAFCLALQGCNKIQPVNWEVTLNQEDKKPYGSYLSYKSLKHFFPGVEIKTLSTGFRYDNIDVRMKYPADGRALMILNGLSFYISDAELEQLIGFARAGNEILLFGNAFDDKLEERLKCYKPYYSLTGDLEDMPLTNEYTGKDNIRCISLASDTNTKYGYQGRTLQGYFQIESGKQKESRDESGVQSGNGGEIWKDLKDVQVDSIEAGTDAEAVEHMEEHAREDDAETTIEEGDNAALKDLMAEEENDDEEESDIDRVPEVLGVVNGNPNMVRYAVGEGHITLHAAPLVMSNYFLLQDRNLEYLQALWNLFPEDISHIYWNSYYKHHAEHSDFGILWKHPATRWALTLSIIALLLYVLLEVKRRQRALAIIKPLENTSVTFVETVGRLYYNKGNHHNLAEKMTQHFLEWVRSHYYLNTNLLDDVFIKNLTAKSGLPIEVVKNLVEMIHEIRLGGTNIDEPYLYHLDNTIQRFYKNKNA